MLLPRFNRALAMAASLSARLTSFASGLVVFGLTRPVRTIAERIVAARPGGPLEELPLLFIQVRKSACLKTALELLKLKSDSLLNSSSNSYGEILQPQHYKLKCCCSQCGTRALVYLFGPLGTQ